MFKVFTVLSSSAPRSVSGEASSLLGEEVDRCIAVVPRFLARKAALLHAREAVSATLAFFVGSGLALGTYARAMPTGIADDACMFSGRRVPEEGGNSGGEYEGIIAAVVATPIVGVSEGR
jgi:hypothetical protein